MEFLSDQQFLSGTIIAERYEVEIAIGSGAMGLVLLVRDQQLAGETAALKILHPHVVLSEKSFSRFQNEVLIMRQLTHQNIVRIFDMGRTAQGEPFISMEHVDGTSLHGLLQETGYELSISQALTILRQIAKGMQAAHERGIIHRDLKPENILITSDGVVKIADFGIARMDGQGQGLTATGETLGTPYYMSPEQIREDEIDHRADIYSFGIMAFELLAGRRPFEGSSFFGLLNQHLTKPLPVAALLEKGAPLWCIECIERCCEKDRAHRFSSAEALLKVLESHSSDHDTTRVGVYTLSERRRRIFRRKGMVFKLWTLGILAFIIALVVAFADVTRSPLVYQSYAARVLFSIETTTGLSPDFLYNLFGIQYRPTSKALANAVDRSNYNGTEYELHAILGAGVDPNAAPDATSPPPIFSAIATANSMPVEALLRAGANPNQVYNNETPLTFALRQGKVSCMGALLSRGSNPLLPDGKGKVTLDAATVSGGTNTSPSLLKLILQQQPGIDLNVTFANGRTPLTRAIEFKKAEMVKVLLAGSSQFQADPLYRDAQGMTALEYAKLRGDETIIAMLQDATNAAGQRRNASTPK